MLKQPVLFLAFIYMLTENGEPQEADLGKLEALQGVTQFPMRIKCATLAWHAMHNACNESTESLSEGE